MGTNPKFTCPECGSHEFDASMEQETAYKEDAPWTAVLWMHRCARCRSVIPAHLAELWENLTPDQAKTDWQERYRGSQPKFD
jgi:hypothetical protein